MSTNRLLSTVLLALFGLPAACMVPPSPTSTIPSPTNTRVLLAPTGTATAEIVFTDIPSPSPTAEPRTLVLCIGAEPETLFIYGGSMLVMSHVLNAIYDGPIDMVSYEYRPVILEKIPSLADGDARFTQVSVRAGDRIVDASGVVVNLVEGSKIRPPGCRSGDCALDYTQGEVLMDQLSADFTLLTGVRWSDGTPVSADDSVYSFHLALEVRSVYQYASSLGDPVITRTAAYEALDPLSVRWTGLPGYLNPDYSTAFWTPLPEHAWGDYPAGELLEADFARAYPLGYGPYVIDEYRVGSHIRLHKNPYYFRATEGLPKFDALVFRFVGENSVTNLARLTSGECDLIDQDAQMDDLFFELIDLDQQGFLNLEVTPGRVFEHLDFGIRPIEYDDGYQPGIDRPDFFSDVRVRQAIMHCVDRPAINEALYGRKSAIFHSYIPQTHPLFNADGPIYSYSPTMGRELLTQAGWTDLDNDEATPRIAIGIAGVPDGTAFTVNLWTTTATARMQQSEIIVASLRSCGIEVLAEFWPPGEFFADGPGGPVFGRRFDLVTYAWLTGVRPPCEFWITEEIPGLNEKNAATLWEGTNATGYSNPAFDAACKAALDALPGEPDYAASHLLAQEIFMQELPVLPLVARLKLVVTRPDFCGMDLDPTANSEMWNIEEFDIGEVCKK